MLELVLFDMDGVVFEGRNFWLDLHRLMGTEKQAWQLWSGLARRDYRRLSELTAGSVWRGRSSAPMLELVRARRPVAGIAEVFAFLAARGIRSAIVSSGPYQLAARAQSLFGVDAIRANRLEIGPDGVFTGKVEVQVDDSDKGAAARELMQRFGADRDTTAAIVDSASDIPIAELVSLSIAYSAAEPALRDKCTLSLPEGEMAKAIEYLRARSAR